MTDPDRTPETPPPASPLEELASATLDGEASAPEQAGAAGETGEPGEAGRDAGAELATQIAGFAEVSRLVATPVAPVDDEQRDAAVAAALAAWGTGGTSGEPVAPVPGDELARRRARAVRTRRWLGAAAAVLVAAGLGAIVVTAGGDDADTTAGDSPASDATTAAEGAVSNESGTGAYDRAESDDSAESGQSEAGAGGDADGVAELGDFTDLAQLLSAAEDYTAARLADPTAPAASTLPDDGESAMFRLQACVPDSVDEAPSAATAVAVATLEGRQVAILADNTAGETRLVVVDLDDCTVVGTRTP